MMYRKWFVFINNYCIQVNDGQFILTTVVFSKIKLYIFLFFLVDDRYIIIFTLIIQYDFEQLSPMLRQQMYSIWSALFLGFPSHQNR